MVTVTMSLTTVPTTPRMAQRQQLQHQMQHDNCVYDHNAMRHCVIYRNYSLIICLMFFLLYVASIRNTSHVVLFTSYLYASNGLKAHNPQCPREHRIPQGSRTYSHKVPLPVTSGTVFCRQGCGWPKKTLELPIQNTN